MNFLLAIIVLTIGFRIGMAPLVSDPASFSGEKLSQVMVVQVIPDSPAEKVGLGVGNILKGFATPDELQQFTQSHKNQEVNLTVQKGKNLENFKLKLASGEAPLGVGVVTVTQVKLPLGQAFIAAVSEVLKSILTIFQVLWAIIASLFTTGKTGVAGSAVVGPVGIFNFTASALKVGWIYILQLLAILSINLGIINILPFPALDGGKILFLALEGIFRKKVVRQEVENLIHTIGFIILIVLILAITLRDILRFR